MAATDKTFLEARSRRAARWGFTFVEMLTVMIVVAIVMAIGLPRLGRLKDQGEMASATTRFARAVMAARQAAIQRGKNAYFKHNNSSIWVIIDTTGNGTDSVVVTAPQDLKALHNVQVIGPSGLTTIAYDPRGVSSQTTMQLFQFKHRSDMYDSLCVSKLGNTIRERCP